MYLDWFKDMEYNPEYKNTVRITKALFALQKVFPCLTKADFLRDPENIDLRNALANELDVPGSFVKNTVMYERFRLFTRNS